jgi:hypothetical protein
LDLRYYESQVGKLEKIHTDKNGSYMMTNIYWQVRSYMYVARQRAMPPPPKSDGKNFGYHPHVGCEEMAIIMKPFKRLNWCNSLLYIRAMTEGHLRYFTWGKGMLRLPSGDH